MIICVNVVLMSYDNHVTLILSLLLPGDSRIGVGEKFIGKASTKRDADLKFYCRVSLEEHPDVFVTSRIATVKVKTGEMIIIAV